MAFAELFFAFAECEQTKPERKIFSGKINDFSVAFIERRRMDGAQYGQDNLIKKQFLHYDDEH